MAEFNRRQISIRTILPNLVTLLAFVSGLTAIRFALDGRFELAFSALALAGILDGLDGTVARLLKSTSKFGAELDSLSDVVAFGVAPAVTIYLWALQGMERMGWAAAMIFAMAMALRLARFNAGIDDEDDPKKRLGFFTGVPAPVGCALAILPMALDFAAIEGWLRPHDWTIAAYIALIGLLSVSTIPTPSIKKLRLPRSYFAPALMLVGIVMAGLFARPWLVVSVLSLAYLASLPLCYFLYRRRLEKKGWKKRT